MSRTSGRSRSGAGRRRRALARSGGGVARCRSRSPESSHADASPPCASGGCGAASLARPRPAAARRARQQHARRGCVRDPAPVHPPAGGGRARLRRDARLDLAGLGRAQRRGAARDGASFTARRRRSSTRRPTPSSSPAPSRAPPKLDAEPYWRELTRLFDWRARSSLRDAGLVPRRACAGAASRRRAPAALRAQDFGPLRRPRSRRRMR